MRPARQNGKQLAIPMTIPVLDQAASTVSFIRPPAPTAP